MGLKKMEWNEMEVGENNYSHIIIMISPFNRIDFIFMWPLRSEVFPSSWFSCKLCVLWQMTWSSWLSALMWFLYLSPRKNCNSCVEKKERIRETLARWRRKFSKYLKFLVRAEYERNIFKFWKGVVFKLRHWYETFIIKKVNWCKISFSK